MADLRREWRTWAAVAAAIALLLSALAWNPVTRLAAAEARQTAATTLGIYATLRAFNAFLSSAQEVEVGASFVVAGSVQPLKSLEPIDDTVERVAEIVLLVSIVAGVAGLGFGPLAVLGFALVLAGLALWTRAPPIAGRLISSGVLVALILPLAFLTSAIVGDAMTRSVWAENAAVIDRISSELDASDAVPELEPGPPESMWDRLLGSFQDANALRPYLAAASVLVDEADALLGSYVQILAVWILKLIVLPLALMLIAYRLLR